MLERRVELVRWQATSPRPTYAGSAAGSGVGPGPAAASRACWQVRTAASRRPWAREPGRVDSSPMRSQCADRPPATRRCRTRRRARPPRAGRGATQPRPKIPGRWNAAATLPRRSRPGPAKRTRPYPRLHRGAGRDSNDGARSSRGHSPACWQPCWPTARRAHRPHLRTPGRRHRAVPRLPPRGRWRLPRPPAPAAAGGGTGPGQRASPKATAESSPLRRAGYRPR